VGLNKTYLATVRLGFATDTQDRTGKQITPLCTSKEVSLEELQAVLRQFTGQQFQTPPMFSAKQVDGQRLYKAARAGREVFREPVEIIVHSLDLIVNDGTGLNRNEDGTLDFQIRVECSSGTYVRTLAHDFGTQLETGAHLRELRRIAVGRFSIAQAVSLEMLGSMTPSELEALLIDGSSMLEHLSRIQLDRNSEIKAINGQELSVKDEVDEATNEIRMCDMSGNLIAVGRYDAKAGVVRPIVVLKSVND